MSIPSQPQPQPPTHSQAQQKDHQPPRGSKSLGHRRSSRGPAAVTLPKLFETTASYRAKTGQFLQEVIEEPIVYEGEGSSTTPSSGQAAPGTGGTTVRLVDVYHGDTVMTCERDYLRRLAPPPTRQELLTRRADLRRKERAAVELRRSRIAARRSEVDVASKLFIDTAVMCELPTGAALGVEWNIFKHEDYEREKERKLDEKVKARERVLERDRRAKEEEARRRRMKLHQRY